MPPPLLVVGLDADVVSRMQDDFICGGLLNPVVACRDARDATTYLLGAGADGQHDVPAPPAVVVTGLRLRRGSGLEVLRTVRSRPALRRTPVLVVGGDPDDLEIAEVHRQGATAYLSAAVADGALLEVIRGLGMPWSVDRVGSS